MLLQKNTTAVPSYRSSRTVSVARARSVKMQSSKKPQLLVSSIAGNMGKAVTEAALRRGIEVIPYTLVGPVDPKGREVVKVQGKEFEFVGPNQRVAFAKTLKERYPNLIAVDYTLPDAIHSMVDFYVDNKIPFVMGTTGGDRVKIAKQVGDSGLYSIISPNMCKQIVAFQAMMDYMAKTYPGAFSGYKLQVWESHQATKKDVSGTAIAIVQSLKALGLPFEISQIELVRDRDTQVNQMKVPENGLNGHAYHTYRITSSDGTVIFEFQHNVVGRTTYAEGTVDACEFLAKKIESKAERTFYNMIDVLRG
mmetsp:Transcript_2437/g.3705  ORF Transcript_2437/g.3705 Transcript_2437/m.3705 type:complete len:308 (-) Transcript_2437:166-1089(-)